MRSCLLWFAFVCTSCAPLRAQEAPTVAPESWPAPRPQNAPNAANSVTNTPTNAGTNGEANEDAQQVARVEAGETRLRALLEAFGFTSEATQNAIIDHIGREEAARRSVRESARRLVVALRRGEAPERVSELVESYKTAIAADRERRRADQNALDARVGFSLDPRLEGLLWVSGILGDGGLMLSQIAPLRRAPEAPIANVQMAGANVPNANVANVQSNLYANVYDTPNAVQSPFQNTLQNAAPSALEVRRGVVIGTLLSRGDVRGGEVWIEVGAERGPSERFVAWWQPQIGGFDPKMLATMMELPLGVRVRVEWLGEVGERERKQIVALSRADEHSDAKPATETLHTAPNTIPDAAPN